MQRILRMLKIFRWLGCGIIVVVGSVADFLPPSAFGNEETTVVVQVEYDSRRVVDSDTFRAIEETIDSGLRYLAKQQQDDGSFHAPPSGQPGVTSLAVLAFLSRGHLPGHGPYGEHIEKAVRFVLQCQRSDGLFSLQEPERSHVHDGATHAGNYNHAISGLMLGEIYGMTADRPHQEISVAIEKGLVFLRQQQLKPKRRAHDNGGWRYLRQRMAIDADLSVTSWQLMFLRSARNAEFVVPKEYIDAAMEYIHRCFDHDQQTFVYGLSPRDRLATRGVVGGGIVSLSLGGQHESEMAIAAGDWILRQSFDEYNRCDHRSGYGPYHYGAYYCSQAMFQLGGVYWQKFFPRMAQVLITNQSPDGSWQREQSVNGGHFGQSYTTSLSILALTPAYQILPIYQR